MELAGGNQREWAADVPAFVEQRLIPVIRRWWTGIQQSDRRLVADVQSRFGGLKAFCCGAPAAEGGDPRSGRRDAGTDARGAVGTDRT